MPTHLREFIQGREKQCDFNAVWPTLGKRP